jgi:2,4-dienoyl-CoA reductase-like NADH-dependent reductase (Old Yellow Enzyme family)
MEEGIGYAGLPTQDHHRLYKRWAEGGWGIIITGKSSHLFKALQISRPSS